MPKTISKETREAVVEFYKSRPMSYKDVRDRFNISFPKISEILDEYQIPRYKKAQIFNPSFREDYFKIIDTPTKAYFLGLIFTDGNVFVTEDGKRQASISITLQESDEYLLEAFKQEIKTDTSVAHDGRGAATIAVRSDIMAQDLSRYGIYPRKSLSTTLPDVPDAFMSHFFRGMFDGDGSMQARQTTVRGRYKHSLGICGTKELMEQVRDWLVTHLGVSNNTVYTYKNRPLSMVTWAKADDMYTIGEWMYQDSDICMLRKRDKYEEFKQHYNL